MSKHIRQKRLLNCGRKRKMTLHEAKGQKVAREAENPRRLVRVYKCPKCGTYHTTTAYGGVSKSAWNRI